MHKRAVAILVPLLLVVTTATVGPALWHAWRRPPPGRCSFCLRPEHAESRVVIEAEGERAQDACCVACALSYQRQTGKRVRILSVTEHRTHEVIDPAGAVFVVDSDVSPCQHDLMHLGEDKTVEEIRWDRCLPSILAFASRERAADFQAQHGGTLRTLSELMGTAPSSTEGAGR